jgi:uncharacterized protein YegJ (DUF2314 family)
MKPPQPTQLSPRSRRSPLNIKFLIAALILVYLYVSGYFTSPFSKNEVMTNPNDPDDKMVYLAPDDPRILAAQKEAQDRLEYFITTLKSEPSTSERTFIIKTDFVKDDTHEHMWVEVDNYEDGVFHGALINTPYDLTHLKFGDRVTIERDTVEDWAIRDKDFNVIEGQFSVKALP